MTLTIAIDGPAAAGKGTLARRLAAAYNLAYLDSGSLYRGTALSLLRSGLEPAEPAAVAAARGLKPELLADPEIRAEATGKLASQVAAIPAVRAALLDWQRGFAQHPPEGKRGAVLDGRDIGTVVLPDAMVKLFITASDEARAMRRFKELQAKGETAIYARVLEDMRERDARDTARSTAPMRPAEDALIIDTSAFDADQVFRQAKDHIDQIIIRT
ncbi:(d)CMP kinase [Dongia sedimenti]|uniref:Cytidylate kinase n=1 Tax=Dongia sedimenti TaxID=3064282 RepID=A0ABU0YPL5_9PROT|nr:(d)CMP kinase [Rhodospirillaceae bacterium R-7]